MQDLYGTLPAPYRDFRSSSQEAVRDNEEVETAEGLK